MAQPNGYFSVDFGNNSQLVTLAGGGAAASTTALGSQPNPQLPAVNVSVLIVPTVACYVRQKVAGGADATNTGSDIFLLANRPYQTSMVAGNLLSFNSTAAGTVSVTIGG